MRLFSLTGAIVFLLVYTLIFVFIIIGDFFSLIMFYTGGFDIGIIFILGPIIYFIFYAWKWKKNSKKIFFIASFVIFIIIISGLIWIFLIYPAGVVGTDKLPFIDCIKDENSRTLTIKSIDLGHRTKDLYWSDVWVRGNATIPTYGVIKVNDIIVNCSGRIMICYDPTGHVMYDCEFPD